MAALEASSSQNLDWLKPVLEKRDAESGLFNSVTMATFGDRVFIDQSPKINLKNS